MRFLSLTLGRTHFELCVGQAKQTYFLGTMFSFFKVRAHSSVVEQRSFKPLALGSNPNVLNGGFALLPEVSPSGKAFDFESNRRRFDSVYLRTSYIKFFCL